MGSVRAQHGRPRSPRRRPPRTPWAIRGSEGILVLALQRRDGRFERLPLLGRADDLGTRLPARLRGGRLLALELTIPVGLGARDAVGELDRGPLEAVRRSGRMVRATAFGGERCCATRDHSVIEQADSVIEVIPGGARRSA